VSINLGNDGVAAVRELRVSPAWAALMKALADQARSTANTALDASPELQASACGYARAVRNMYIAFESAASGMQQNLVKKPGIKE
jgi:phytoene/squalene synthetase